MPTRNSKSKRPPTTIRAVIARNVSELRDKKYAYLATATDRNRALAEEMESSLSQVQRLVAGKVGTSSDAIEQLASVFYVEPNQLLIPYFSNSITEDSFAMRRAREKNRKAPTHTQKPAP